MGGLREEVKGGALDKLVSALSQSLRISGQRRGITGDVTDSPRRKFHNLLEHHQLCSTSWWI
jgi:hypothetical protein